jgi:hypothetical protein
MSVNLRSAVGIATIWVATVAGVSATAWFAIDRAGRDISNSGVSSVTTQSLGAASDTTTPGGTTSGATSSPTSKTTTPGNSQAPSVTSGSQTAAAQAPRDRSVTVPGGQISARCSGETILLRIAQPSNGWRVDVKEAGPQVLDLTFERGDEGAEAETRVKAKCVSGGPVFTVENKD